MRYLQAPHAVHMPWTLACPNHQFCVRVFPRLTCHCSHHSFNCVPIWSLCPFAPAAHPPHRPHSLPDSFPCAVLPPKCRDEIEELKAQVKAYRTKAAKGSELNAKLLGLMSQVSSV